MASGHVNRTQRPNTWLHRPSLRREDSPCQLGAVHTWPRLFSNSGPGVKLSTNILAGVQGSLPGRGVPSA